MEYSRTFPWIALVILLLAGLLVAALVQALGRHMNRSLRE
jgi:hypothetical protein